MKRKQVKITQENYDTFILNLMLGVIIGGRLGYVIFYNLSHYISNPVDIIAVWKGGMSFHGGAIGCIIAGLLFAKKYKYNFYSLGDPAMPLVDIGIGLVRVANFINGELYGKITTVPWGVIFPYTDGARHPSQLYQAFVEGFFMAVVLHILLFRTKVDGVVFWCFIGLYGLGRFFIEYLRELDDLPIYTDGMLFSRLPISMGQMFSIIMITSAIIGLYLVLKQKRYHSYKRAKR
jgi:phosphatidylglycerol:prolipoprotein diacylglycerol transferase